MSNRNSVNGHERSGLRKWKFRTCWINSTLNNSFKGKILTMRTKTWKRRQKFTNLGWRGFFSFCPLLFFFGCFKNPRILCLFKSKQEAINSPSYQIKRFAFFLLLLYQLQIIWTVCVLLFWNKNNCFNLWFRNRERSNHFQLEIALNLCTWGNETSHSLENEVIYSLI